MSDPSPPDASRTGRRCPICGKPTNPAARPFCSKRCADVDLQRWLTDRYAIPVEDDEEPDESPPGAGGDRSS